jgi:putative flippase GtrA
MVGVLNTAVQYLLFLFLYRVAGMNYIVASAIGYCAGITNSYLWNRVWTFHSEESRKGLEFGKFILVNAVSMAVNLGILRYSVKHLEMRPEIGQIIAIAFSMAANFIGNKFWTFRKMKARYCIEP